MKIKFLCKVAAFFYVFFLSTASSVATAGELVVAPTQVPLAVNSVHIRTLAASCAACHGTNGHSAGGLPSIAGSNVAYFTLQMQAFASGERKATVMHHHAKGLTAQEIDQLALYFAAQKPAMAISPKPLK